MRALLLIGGLLGFGIGLLFSWAEASSWPACLWHASLAAYLTGLLVRWWGGAWRKNLEDALREQQSVAAAAAAAAPSIPLTKTKS
jgi:hypothetical protein